VFSKSYFLRDDGFPANLAELRVEDLIRLSSALQEQIFRECNGRAAWARQETLMRQALVDLEIAFRVDEEPPPGRRTAG
jgi:hypothetical protein